MEIIVDSILNKFNQKLNKFSIYCKRKTYNYNNGEYG